MFNNLYELLFPWKISDEQLLFYLRTFRPEDIATLHSRPLSSVNYRIDKIVKKLITINEPFISIMIKTKISEEKLREMINNYNFEQLSKKSQSIYKDIK